MPTPKRTSVSFRFDTKAQVDYVNNWFANLVTSRGELGKKGEALQYLLDQYDLAFKNIRFRDVPDSVEALIQEADCQYLRYEPYKENKLDIVGFVCYEFFSMKKKPSILGSEHELILNRCIQCKAGKLDKIERQVQTQLRKKNIKGLLDLRDILINLQIEGGIAQIYICKGELLENKKIIVSTDGIHLRCPLEPEEKDVQVKSHCYNQITPWTTEPPCQYLIDPYINVKIEPSEKASEAIERIALELQEGLPEPEAITVEAEVIDDSETTIPKYERKKNEMVDPSNNPLEPEEEKEEEK